MITDLAPKKAILRSLLLLITEETRHSNYRKGKILAKEKIRIVLDYSESICFTIY